MILRCHWFLPLFPASRSRMFKRSLQSFATPDLLCPTFRSRLSPLDHTTFQYRHHVMHSTVRLCFERHILRDLTHWSALCRLVDGLYILMKPRTKKIPSHLLDYVLRVNSTRNCRWKTRGPRYSQPSPVQVRSCVSEVGHQRGDLWTMVC